MDTLQASDSKKPFLAPQQPFPQNPGPAFQPRRSLLFAIRHIFHKFWILEALASGFSSVVFASILILLASYDHDTFSTISQDGKLPKSPVFPFLAFLSAIMRASMSLSVATAIGQLKWSWFRAGHRLIDMERFDEASRGILGSLSLLWTVRFR